MQAREYADAAETVTIITKPLLLYYCAMSLALAEVLFKQEGASSLDQARGENAHHGLKLKCSVEYDSNDNAKALNSIRAIPHISANNKRVGTFNLWHHSSREAPLIGGLTIRDSFNVRKSVNPIFLASDEKPKEIGEAGLSLLDCVSHLPGFYEFLDDAGLSSSLVRTMASQDVVQNKQQLVSMIIHPDAVSKLELLYNLIKFKPRMFERVSVTEFASGVNLVIDTLDGDDIDIDKPFSYTQSIDQIFISCTDYQLNEFGFMYIALYMTGMFSRYFPDMWVNSVEKSNFLSVVVDRLMDCVRTRVPLLILSELSGGYLVKGKI